MEVQRTAGNGAASVLLQRDEATAELGVRFNDAAGRGAWPAAVRILAEMSATDRREVLTATSSGVREDLRTAAAGLDPTPDNLVIPDIEHVETAYDGVPSASPDSAPPVALNVASMSATDKLIQAWTYAKESLDADVAAQIDSLLTLRSVAMMAGFAALYVAAQLTPAGWAADGIALATLTISAIFLGSVVFDVTTDMMRFFNSVNASSDQELRAGGAALSRAIAEGGVNLVVAFIGWAVGGRGGGRPYEGPPPTGYVEALTPEGVLIRMPAIAVQEAATLAPSALRQAAALAIITGPPGPPPGHAGGDESPSPAAARGPEVFDEISREMQLDPATAEAAPADAAGAAADAEAGGLMGPKGAPGTVDLATQPHGSASIVRGQYGVSGSDVQSAHVGPTSFLRDLPGYSRRGADTVLLDRATHAAFDQHWKDWAMEQRRNGRVDVEVSELYAVMLDAIDQIPSLEQRTKNAMAWRLQLELFRDLGLSPASRVALPYANVAPSR